MDRLRAMQIFTAVAEAGSLSAASREMGVPLTTVSRQLAELEKHVGTPLIVRTTRQLALTDAGRDYLETCRNLLSELEAAEARLAGKDDAPSGELVLTAPVVFGRLHVLPVVLEYLRRYPDVSVKMVLADCVIDLVDESIDVGIRIGALPDSAMIARQAGTVRYVVCASPAYLQARGEPASPRDLSKHDCIVFSGLETGGRWLPRVGQHAARAHQFPVKCQYGGSCRRCGYCRHRARARPVLSGDACRRQRKASACA